MDKWTSASIKHDDSYIFLFTLYIVQEPSKRMFFQGIACMCVKGAIGDTHVFLKSLRIAVSVTYTKM